MGDAIDERNRRDKIARSIVKYWNVNYTLPPQVDDKAEEILQRLQEEAEADEAAKWAEIDALIEQQRLQQQEAEGASESPAGEVTEGQIEQILYEEAEGPGESESV